MSSFIEGGGKGKCPFGMEKCNEECEWWRVVSFNDGKVIDACVFNWIAFFLERLFNQVVKTEEKEDKENKENEKEEKNNGRGILIPQLEGIKIRRR